MNRIQRIIEPFGHGTLEPEYGEEVFLTAPTEEEEPPVVRRRLVEAPPVPEPIPQERPHHPVPQPSNLHAVRLGGFYGVENPFLVFYRAVAHAGLPVYSFYFSTLADNSQFCVLVFSGAADADRAYERLRYFPFNATVASVARLR